MVARLIPVQKVIGSIPVTLNYKFSLFSFLFFLFSFYFLFLKKCIWSHSVMVITQGFDSCDLGSIPSGTL